MNLSSIIKWSVLGLAGVLLVALFIFNSQNRPENPHIKGEPWNSGLVLGDLQAPNRMVEYSDYFCEFCAYFNEQAGSTRFQEEYINSGKVRLETRMITVLKEKSPNTEQGAEAAFCAADQQKFLEYSNDLIPRIRRDFFDKNIGTKNGGNYRPIEKLPLSYFTQSATSVELDTEKFDSCMTSRKHQKKIAEDTERAVRLGVSGLPTIIVNDFTASGFADGWRGFEIMLKTGGVPID